MRNKTLWKRLVGRLLFVWEGLFSGCNNYVLFLPTSWKLEIASRLLSFKNNRVIFHFYDYERKGSHCKTQITEKGVFMEGKYRNTSIWDLCSMGKHIAKHGINIMPKLRQILLIILDQKLIDNYCIFGWLFPTRRPANHWGHLQLFAFAIMSYIFFSTVR